MTRTVKKGDKSVEVDLGGSWKIFDNNNINKTFVVYHGVIFRTKDRVFWVETDQGGFIVDPAVDNLKPWAELAGMEESQLSNILRDPKDVYACRKI
jgi:hypothetical protein